MDSDEGEEQKEEAAPQGTGSFASALSALEEHPSSQVIADTNVKQPRTLSTIDGVLVDKTQPEPEEELEDNFNYENTEEVEEPGPEEMAEEITPAQQNVSETDQFDSPDVDKENNPSTDNERYVRQVVSQLPLSKIKKIMKMDPDTKLIQNDSVLLVAFATELFIKALSTAAARCVFFSDIIFVLHLEKYCIDLLLLFKD